MRDLGHIDHGYVPQPAIQLAQTCVHHALALLGGVILSVFTEIAVSASPQNLSRKLNSELDFERRDLLLKLLLELFHALRAIIAPIESINVTSFHIPASRVAMTTPAAFKPAERSHTSFLAAAEKRALIWIAGRLPEEVNSDHLTALGFVSLVGAGAAY